MARGRTPLAVEPVPALATEDVVDPANAHHHDPARLAAAELTALFRWLCQQVRLLPGEQPQAVTGSTHAYSSSETFDV